MSDGGGDEAHQDEAPAPVPKPDALLALHTTTETMFETLRRWFGVGPSISLNLGSIDSATAELSDPVLIAAMAMRKLQALHLLSTPGVRTTTDVIVAIVQDLDRALLQAPNMYLELRAESTDWDSAFAMLDANAADHSDGDDPLADAPIDADELDPEIEDFRHMHAELHEAMYAVVEASAGEIRIFE